MIRYKKILFLIVFLLVNVSVSAQESFYDSPAFKAAKLNSSALDALEEGCPEKAVKYYSQSLSLLMETGDSLSAATVLSNMSSVYLSLYEYELAVDALNTAEELCMKGKGTVNNIIENSGNLWPDDAETVRILVALMKVRADICQELGNNIRAIKIDSVILDKVPYGSKDYFNACCDIASAYIRTEEYHSAFSFASEALAVSAGAADSLSAYMLLARVEAMSGNGRNARNNLKRASSLIPRLINTPAEFNLACTSAEVNEILCSYGPAISEYENAINMGVPLFGSGHPDIVSLNYGLAKSLLLNGRISKACDIYGRYASGKISYMDSLATEIKDYALYPFWINSSEGLAEVPLFCAMAGDSLNGEFVSKALNIVLYSKNYTSGQYAHGMPDWKNSARCMSDNSVAVEFVQYDDGRRFGAFVYRNGYSHPDFMEIGSMDELCSIVGNEQPQDDIVIKSAFSVDNMSCLYEMIWRPLAGYFSPDDTVYFSAAGRLANLPLEYLLEDGVPFVESQASVERLSSTAGIPEHAAYTDEYDRLTAFMSIDYANVPHHRGAVSYFSPLDGRREDLNNMRKIFKDRMPSEFYTGTDASEYVFKHLDTTQRNGILHLSTHGFYFTENEAAVENYYSSLRPEDLKYLPLLRSGIVMAGANLVWTGRVQRQRGADDGILTSQEIASLDLRGFSLVALAACQTGLGELSQEGVLGLQYAFKFAGAGKILVSLWPVDNKSTTILMKFFYENLMSGFSPEESLAMASASLRSHGKYSDPYYWAAFVLAD